MVQSSNQIAMRLLGAFFVIPKARCYIPLQLILGGAPLLGLSFAELSLGYDWLGIMVSARLFYS
ncbi:hypothetical protein LINGRAHAP2_LOCUS24013 [Linum grandiflorum]